MHTQENLRGRTSRFIQGDYCLYKIYIYKCCAISLTKKIVAIAKVLIGIWAKNTSSFLAQLTA